MTHGMGLKWKCTGTLPLIYKNDYPIKYAVHDNEKHGGGKNCQCKIIEWPASEVVVNRGYIGQFYIQRIFY